ncbi:DUF475 domain-containing protein [Aeromicrobium sp.]|nr:DUF475 domain-containing protein [Candidatus Saccharibacteria bacterium]
MKNIFHSNHPFRIFAISGLFTIAGIIGVLIGYGPASALVILILIAVEIAFSFDNAIINAKTLAKLSEFWQKIFLTVGIFIAVIGMRVVFPILIVSLSAHLSWSTVIDLALNHPGEYAEKLEAAHPAIAAFGGAFLLMLALEFFIDDKRDVMWLKYVERPLQRLSSLWAPGLLSVIAVVLVALVPANHHARTTVIAGILGIVTHISIELFTNLFGSRQNSKASLKPLTGMAAFSTFIYLEILDASFSFDGVIGAFAITSKVVLIAIGLGIGALWVRSLTVFMVKKGTLQNYIYLEHGAHYTVAVLAGVLLISLFFEIPDVLAGVAGLGFIGASIYASQEAMRARNKPANS